MSTQQVEELIPMIFSDIQSKRKIIDEYRSRFPSNADTITLNAFEFFDIIDEFDITISQSLQAMQTLQTEILNLQEKNQNNNIIDKDTIGNTMLNDTSKLYFDYSQVKGYSQLINSNISDEEKNDNVNMIKKELMCKENNIVVTENEEPPIEENSNHILSNIQETDTTNAINEVHLNTKLPIRQSLRQMIKSGKKSTIDTNSNETKQKRKSDNSTEEKIKNLLTKIGTVERYRIYFGEKYGQGDYDVFISKLNNNEIEKDVLMDELTIIADLMTKQLDEGKTKKSIKGNNNKRSKEVVKSNAYIEPIKFSSYLRNGDDYKGKSKRKNMSFSKEKIYK